MFCSIVYVFAKGVPDQKVMLLKGWWRGKVWEPLSFIRLKRWMDWLIKIHLFVFLDTGHLSTVVSEAFVRFFVELVGHYPLFITAEREDGYSSSSSSSPASCAFQREGFRKAIPSKTVRRFLEVFMETQMFGWFIQERELHRQALRGTKRRKRGFGFGRLSECWWFWPSLLLTGLFEVRVQEYLDSINENEHRRVNRFLKGLGKNDSDQLA